MKKTIGGALIIILVLLFFVSGIYALEVSVENNSAGSSTSITVNNSSSVSVSQDNSAIINNNVGSNTDTGNNSGSAVTGDASNQTNITNNFNNNFADPGCCSTTAKPTDKPEVTTSPTPDPANPTPTSKPEENTSNPTGGSDPGGSSNPPGGIGGGDILGLSATDSGIVQNILTAAAGFICLLLASVYYRKSLA